jgi:hypothetical protein
MDNPQGAAHPRRWINLSHFPMSPFQADALGLALAGNIFE